MVLAYLYVEIKNYISGTIGVMPIGHYPTTSDIRDDNFRSYYTHDEEQAEPGYYKVRHIME
jgi:hypothetical protein